MTFNEVLRCRTGKGRKYRITGITQLEETKKFVKSKREYRSQWYVFCRFLDKDEELVRLMIDYNDMVIGQVVVKPEEKTF